MPRIPLVIQSYRSESLPVSAQRLVNCYAESFPEDAKVPVAVFGWPGLETFTTCGDGPIRGFHIMGGLLYVVSGHDLYTVTSAGTATVVGTGIIGTDRVSMANNGTQICIVAPPTAYIYSDSTGLDEIIDGDFNTANTVTYYDGYFVFDRRETNQFFISELLDGASYDALDFASAEVSTDRVVGVIRRKDNLLVLGEETIETMYNDPAQDFPMNRIGGGLIERGCSAPLTALTEDNALFFLGNDRVFYRLDDITPKRLSTHPLEREWASYATVDDAFCDIVAIKGHKFVVLTFPSQPATFVFDIATGLWHERESWDAGRVSRSRWTGNACVSVYGFNLAGDAYSGKIGKLNDEVFTEFGNVIPATLTLPPLQKDRKRLFIGRLELDMETGTGLTTGQGSDPQVMMDYSNDGGRTFVNRQLWNSCGALGEYRKRLRWLRQGSAYSRIYRFTMTDPVKRVFHAAHADVTLAD